MRYVCIIINILICINTMALEKTDYLKLLPSSAIGWNASDDGIIYDKTTLYEYIDGGAELYISYGFINVFSIQYKKERNPSVYVEIFDMGSSYNAFGVFSNSNEKINTEIGQGGQYIEGSLMFWKNDFFISLYTDYEEADVKEAMYTLARHIEKSIGIDGEKPVILNFLPLKNLNTESLVYFKHHAWQNYYHYICDENIFGISPENDAVHAKYTIDGENIYVLLIQYDQESDALNSIQKANAFFNESTDQNNKFINLGDDIQALMMREKTVVIFIYGSDLEKINSLSENIHENIKSKENGK